MNRYPPEVEHSRIMKKIIDQLRDGKARTNTELAAELNLLPCNTRRQTGRMLTARVLKVAGYAPATQPNCLPARRYTLTSYALNPPPPNQSDVKTVWHSKVPEHDNNLHRHIINQAKHYGPFGVLVVQATGV